MAKDEDFDVRDRPHISMDAFREAADYVAPRSNRQNKPLHADYAAHAERLLDQLTRALGELPTPMADPRLRVEGLKSGIVVEVATLPPVSTSRAKAVKIPAELDFSGQEIVVLRTERRSNSSESALLFVPDDARAFLRGRIAAYGRAPGPEPRPDVQRFEVIETIAAASASALFATAVDLTATEVIWWEVWVQGDIRRADRLAALAQGRAFDVHPARLHFPDTTVVFLHGRANEMAAFAERVPGAISEIRRATGTIEPFLERGAGLGQHDWVADMAERTSAPSEDAPVVCALDTGVAAAHPLVVPGLRGAWSYDAAWGTDDHAPQGGHGTALVSLILYGDLEPHFNGTGPIELTHFAESMKLLPPPAFPATQPPSYGVVTQGAVAQVEIERPLVKRSFCLATSATDFPPSRPSSWSGALDQIASGAMPGDIAINLPATKTPKRLLLVATGNVEGGMRNEVLPSQPLEDPSQAWNVLTVGGFTRKEQVPQPPPRLRPAVRANHRSPYSRGSQSLPEDLTPIKPEVLFEAGNMLEDQGGYCGSHEAVALLAAGSNVQMEPLVPFWATSAAVGVAGNFIGRLQAALPHRWPETYRALAVDSAVWPQPIKERLVGPRGAHWKTGSKAEKQQLLREVGYGVPDLERAISSARNNVTLTAEAEIQPFILAPGGYSAVFNEMHFYELPWPRVALQQLENEIVTMKVTLSYFIEPNLTGKAATRPSSYRSFGLRFAMKKRTESQPAFRARVNKIQAQGDSNSEDEQSYWLLGPKAIQAGSLHCDLWRGHAVDLAGHDAIAVFPVGGWWKTHNGQKRQNDKGRYTLVISISAPGQAIDIHAEIANLVQVREIEI